MNTSLKITKIGNSAGLVLPKAILQQLNVGLGDTLHAFATPKGLRLTVVTPQSLDKMAIAEKIMSEDKEILRSLATASNFDDQIEVACAVMERRKTALRALSKK